MKCRYPVIVGNQALPCGQCLACRFNRRRTWTHRIMLEAAQYEQNCFVTLTYNNFWMPRVSSSSGLTFPEGTLMPRHSELWLKRFRKAISPSLVRFYLVGEYGDESWRPHYHVALFNHPPCEFGRTRRKRHLAGKSCCRSCDVIFETWSYGAVDVGTLTDHSAQYTAGYVTKKMTKEDDERLLGRVPEFSRMSKGVGVGMMHELASDLMRFNLDESQTDVPVSLQHGSRKMPLGRHLRRKLREFMGRDPNVPMEKVFERIEELRPLLEAAKADTSSALPLEFRFRERVIKEGDQKYKQMIARDKIFRKGKVL